MTCRLTPPSMHVTHTLIGQYQPKRHMVWRINLIPFTTESLISRDGHTIQNRASIGRQNTPGTSRPCIRQGANYNSGVHRLLCHSNICRERRSKFEGAPIVVVSCFNSLHRNRHSTRKMSGTHISPPIFELWTRRSPSFG